MSAKTDDFLVTKRRRRPSASRSRLKAKLYEAEREIERLHSLVPRVGGSEMRNRFAQELAQHYHMLHAAGRPVSVR